ncbi:glycosyltransferase family 4 protein [Fredinandcohnia onubensis]|uniref:glycosyltransferase family 4 protein n=1 Tax=Fredinandcohnia onubensis TaxID=1571209 RepID=UPI000C0BB8FB|nr:glycosyltransferase family 4 protein [Fredinandcohnia onubensis]
MKVLFVLNSGFDTPGPSNHLLESIIENLLQDGCKVHVIEKHKTGQKPDIPPSISNNENLTYDTCKVKNVPKTSFAKRYLSDIMYAFSCLKYYKKQKDIDVAFLQSCNTAIFHLLLLKLFIRKPVVFNVQDIFPLNALMVGKLSEKSPIFKVVRFLQRSAYKMADKIITISFDMKKTLENEKVNKDKINVIYNWSYSDELIDIQNKSNKFIKENNIEDSHYKVVYAGNIGEVQNIDIIMVAAKLLKEIREIRFYIIGEGVQKEKYLKYAKDNNLENVLFYPMQPPEYAPHIYSMADINIIPLSKGIIKTALPSKTATCLSCGKPIIACVDLDSEFSKMIDSLDKCSVVDSNDEMGLAKCIMEKYENSIRGISIDEQDLFKRDFTKQENVDKYVNLIKAMAVIK